MKTIRISYHSLNLLLSRPVIIQQAFLLDFPSSRKILFYIFTGRNEVVAKVMFLHVCVILFTGGVSGQGAPPLRQGDPPGRETPWDQTPLEQTPPQAGRPTPGTRHPPEQTPPPWEQTPPRADTPPGSRHPPQSRSPRKQTPAYDLRAAGTHPTGMHSCFQC